MRTIKFRAWDKKTCKMLDFTNEHPLKIADKPLVKNYVEIMQYTGLKDKNGKEIYEGDLLKNNEPHKPIEVKWSNLKGAWKTEYLGLISELQEGFVDGGNGETYNNKEIIGNVWENPELLTL